MAKRERNLHHNPIFFRDLKGKNEKAFRAYVSLFMRHLCEPGNDAAETFADGVPREGLSRQHVLTRIGVMSLIRKKVHEFECINGKHSMPHIAQKLLEQREREKQLKSAAESEATTATNTPLSGTPASTAPASPAPPKDKEEKKQDSEAAKPDAAKEENQELKGEAEEGSKKENKKEGEEKMDVDGKPEKQSGGEGNKEGDGRDQEEKEKEKEKEKDAKKPELNGEASGSGEKKENGDAEKKENGDVKKEDEEKGDSSGEAKKPLAKEEDAKPQKFMFNIADGGFTELHTLWQNEEKAAVPGREYEIWHRRHDYWLLAGKICSL